MPRSSFSLEINPAVLRWARESSGESTEAVAARLGVPERTINEWETGKRIPEWQTLRKLARQYHRPLAALLLPEPPQEPDLPPDFRTLPAARRLSSETRLAIRTARWLQGRAVELNEQLGIERRFSARKIRLSDDPEAAAERFRRTLGIDVEEQTTWKSGHAAYKRWRQALEDQGILIFQLRFPLEEARGFSLFHPVLPVIATNERDPVQARTFTLFHEAGHLLLQEPGICLPSETSLDGARIETFCNRFAAATLIPTNELKSWRVSPRALAGESDTELLGLAARYRVSKYVVLGRLRTAERVTETAYRRITGRWKAQDEARPPRSKEARRGGPSGAAICLRQRGKALVSLVLDATREGLITTHDASAYLGVKVKDLDKLESKRE